MRQTPPQTLYVNLERLPDQQMITMPNGINALCIPIPSTELVRLDMMFGGGTWVQRQPLQAMLAMRLIREGSANFTAKQINEQLDFYGATFNASVSKSYAALTILCLRKYLQPVMDIVSDIIRHPVYEQEPFQVTVQQLFSAFMMKMERVKTRGERLFYESLFGKGHPMANFENQEDFARLSIPLMEDYYHDFIGSRNCTLFITGACDDECVSIISQHLGTSQWGSDTPWTDVKKRLYDEKLKVNVPQNQRFDFDMPQRNVQSAVFAGCLVDKPQGKDRAALILSNMLLGGFFGSRLMKNIREQKGYTYGIGSALVANHCCHVLCVQTETANQYVEPVISEIKKEVHRLIDEPVTEEELNIVKKYYSGNLCRSYEANFSYPAYLMRKIGQGNAKIDTLQMQQFIKELTPTDIQQTVARYFAPERFIWCVAG